MTKPPAARSLRKPRNRIAISAIQRKGGPHTDRKKQQQKEACREPVDDEEPVAEVPEDEESA